MNKKQTNKKRVSIVDNQQAYRPPGKSQKVEKQQQYRPPKPPKKEGNITKKSSHNNS